jgi:hypothetical protein
MSENTAPAVHSVPETEETEPVIELSRRRKALNFVKTNKKATIAVVALGGLVAVSALTGRKTVQVTAQSPLEIEVMDDEAADDQSA